MTIHKLITDEMKKQNITPHKLSKLSGVDTGNLWRFFHKESNHKNPSMMTVLKLMRALEIELGRLSEVSL